MSPQSKKFAVKYKRKGGADQEISLTKKAKGAKIDGENNDVKGDETVAAA